MDRGGGGQADEDVILEDEEQRGARSQPSSSMAPTLTTATMSQLLVDKAQMFHSGRYVCSALGASGTWTLVHILAGKKI